MVEVLRESAPKVDVRQIDALKVDLGMIVREMPAPVGVVGNIPYYITGALVTRLAELDEAVAKIVLMIQKEVADRITAPPSNSLRSSLSVFLQGRFDIRVVMQVHAAAFVPPPKVDSTVLELVPNAGVMREDVDRIVRASFAQPRKTLLNNLASGLGIDRVQAGSSIEMAGLRSDVRPHMLTLEDWRRLADVLRGLDRS
jgi:16S rRNA (adenine1518-N6/adenine1519-N6)-dimethyltransferase